MSQFAYNITDKAVTLMIYAKTYTVGRGDDRYEDVVTAIRNGDTDEIPAILDLKGRLISESNGGLYLLNGRLRSDEYDVPATLATRIITMFKEGFDTKPLTNFLENLMQNPNESGTVREETYGWLEANNMPLTPDGCFLAYKMVRKDFKDLHTGRMDNSVGTVVEMDRASCDMDASRHCSTGLHFCSEEYLPNYSHSNQVVVVKVNPRDITSIPSDYCGKGRACRYEIVDAISWDDIIKPNFEDKYSDEPEQEELDLEALDEAVAADEELSFRWEARDAWDGTLVETFITRKEARDFIRDEEMFIWDATLQRVAGGSLLDDYLADYLAEDGLPDEFLHDTQTVPAPVATPGAKLTSEDVADIKSELNDMQSRESPYESYAELARAYGVSDRSIRRIRDGEAWVDVDPSR